MLKARFADSGKIVRAAITALKDTPSPRPQDHTGLTKLYQALRSTVVTLLLFKSSLGLCNPSGRWTFVNMEVREGLTCLTWTDGSQNMSEEDNTWCMTNHPNVRHLTGVNHQNRIHPWIFLHCTSRATHSQKGEEPTNKEPKSPACLRRNQAHPLYRCNEFKRKPVP